MQMSTAHFRIAAISCVLFPFLLPASASADVVGPFKDDLFAAQTVLESRDGGDFTVVDYDEMRDINGRDSIPETAGEGPLCLSEGPSRPGEPDAAAPDRAAGRRTGGAGSGPGLHRIFIHGRGGDRRLGLNDISFGGNFNRLKNLVAESGGTYYAPSVRSFDKKGVADIAALIAHASAQSGGRPVVLACASMGSFICWGISRDTEAVSKLAGMAILGGAPDPALPKSAAAKASLPIWFTMGAATASMPQRTRSRSTAR